LSQLVYCNSGAVGNLRKAVFQDSRLDDEESAGWWVPN
jgi:hypothetical protein